MRINLRAAMRIAQVRWWLEKISPAGPSFRGRGLTKVAPYEVLGNEAKNRSVPRGTIEMLGFWSCTRLSDRQHLSIVPFLRRRPDYGGQAGTDAF
jgi:hypothetical protein